MSLTLLETHQATAKHKRSAAYAAELWKQWPRKQDWPAVLDLYEAAAYRRVEYKTIWRACRVGKTDGKSALRHQRFGAAYRIDKDDLERFGRVEGRAA